MLAGWLAQSWWGSWLLWIKLFGNFQSIQYCIWSKQTHIAHCVVHTIEFMSVANHFCLLLLLMLFLSLFSLHMLRSISIPIQFRHPHNTELNWKFYSQMREKTTAPNQKCCRLKLSLFDYFQMWSRIRFVIQKFVIAVAVAAAAAAAGCCQFNRLISINRRIRYKNDKHFECCSKNEKKSYFECRWWWRLWRCL